MWYLEAFDSGTKLLVRDFPMKELTTAQVKDLLQLGDSIEIDGVRYPLEAGGFDIPDATLVRFATYIDGDFRADPNCEYQVSFFDE